MQTILGGLTLVILIASLSANFFLWNVQESKDDQSLQRVSAIESDRVVAGSPKKTEELFSVNHNDAQLISIQESQSKMLETLRL
mgnify:CR=1 FL=1